VTVAMEIATTTFGGAPPGSSPMTFLKGV
jgi:hypothetical protein